MIEIAELDSMTRAEVSRIKAFMSRATDRFRPPYGKQVIESPRQCVFAGSVNHSTYLRDETGGRRFWPVRCGEIDVDALARDRNQLWAEAVSQYRAGEVWWLETRELIQEAEQQQSDRYEEDPWQSLIAAWVEDPQERVDVNWHPVPARLASDDESLCRYPEHLESLHWKAPGSMDARRSKPRSAMRLRAHEVGATPEAKRGRPLMALPEGAMSCHQCHNYVTSSVTSGKVLYFLTCH